MLTADRSSTRNTTDSLNLLARSLPQDTSVVLFDTEHVDRDGNRPLLERVVSLAAVAIEQARARVDLEYRAYHDELTGLPNRALLNDRLIEHQVHKLDDRGFIREIFQVRRAVAFGCFGHLFGNVRIGA